MDTIIAAPKGHLPAQNVPWQFTADLVDYVVQQGCTVSTDDSVVCGRAVYSIDNVDVARCADHDHEVVADRLDQARQSLDQYGSAMHCGEQDWLGDEIARLEDVMGDFVTHDWQGTTQSSCVCRSCGNVALRDRRTKYGCK